MTASDDELSDRFKLLMWATPADEILDLLYSVEKDEARVSAAADALVEGVNEAIEILEKTAKATGDDD